MSRKCVSVTQRISNGDVAGSRRAPLWPSRTPALSVPSAVGHTRGLRVVIRAAGVDERNEELRAMGENDLLAEEFQRNRNRLRVVAYRMLGSISDADDAVQEAWLRLSRSDSEAIANLPGWLTSVVARVALDMLKARHARHVDYVGSWLPEPVVVVD